MAIGGLDSVMRAARSVIKDMVNSDSSAIFKAVQFDPAPVGGKLGFDAIAVDPGTRALLQNRGAVDTALRTVTMADGPLEIGGDSTSFALRR